MSSESVGTDCGSRRRSDRISTRSNEDVGRPAGLCDLEVPCIPRLPGGRIGRNPWVHHGKQARCDRHQEWCMGEEIAVAALLPAIVGGLAAMVVLRTRHFDRRHRRGPVRVMLRACRCSRRIADDARACRSRAQLRDRRDDRDQQDGEQCHPCERPLGACRTNHATSVLLCTAIESSVLHEQWPSATADSIVPPIDASVRAACQKIVATRSQAEKYIAESLFATPRRSVASMARVSPGAPERMGNSTQREDDWRQPAPASRQEGRTMSPRCR